MTADELAQQLLPMLEELAMVLAGLRADPDDDARDESGDEGGDAPPTGGSALIPLASFSSHASREGE